MKGAHAIRIGVGAALGALFAFGCALLTDLDPLTKGRDLPVDAAPADSTIDTGPGSDGEVPSSDGGTCEAGYREMVLVDKPVAYWRLGEPPGEIVATDESGNGNHGTYRGVDLGAPGAIACDPNHALQNDSTGSVTVDDQIHFAGTLPLTLEAWAAFEAADQPRFVGKGSYTLFWWGSGVRFDRLGTSSHCACIAFEGDGGALLDGRYHHFVGTYDTVTMRVYVDGVEIKKCPCDLEIPDDAGTLSLASNGFAGKLDEVAIYDKALPTPTVEKHFAARAP